jgi:aspartate aminotransferase
MSSGVETKAEKTFQLSDRVNRIAVSPTAAVVNEAEKLKARGVDLADFGMGEPDFATPEHIKQAAIRALNENHTKYTATAGIAPLRQAICTWHGAQLGSSYQPAECVVNVGGKHALFNVICSLINSGDEVVIPAPYWVSYPDIVKYAGGKPVFLQTREDDGFGVRAAELEKVLSPKTRMVIINSPSNPTGAVVAPAEFQKILALCRERGIWLLSDECYSHFVYGDAKPFSIASQADSKNHVIIIGSFSKTFAMTGWRLGYVLAPKPLVDAVIKMQSQSTSNPNSITQYAALAALNGPMDTVAAMLAEYDRRRKHIVAGLRAIPGIRCNDPQGAFYVFPNIANCKVNGAAVPRTAAGEADSSWVAREMLERAHVALVPGDGFGAPGYLRLSYAASIEKLDEGIRRLTKFFS